MPLDTRGTNTMAEGLRKLLSQIMDLKVLDDAPEHMPFLIDLETQVLQHLRQGVEQAFQPQPQGMAQGMPGPTGMQAPVPGMMAGPSMPNPDELRRVLQR